MKKTIAEIFMLRLWVRPDAGRSRKKMYALVCCLMLQAAWVPEALCVPLTLSISGRVTSVDDYLSHLYFVNAEVTLVAHINSDALGGEWCGLPDYCRSAYGNAITSLTLMVGDQRITGENLTLGITNNTPADEFQIPWANVSAPRIEGLDPALLVLDLIDFSAQAWDSTRIPTSLSLDQFDISSHLFISYEDRAINGARQARFSIETLGLSTTVPEPSTLALFGLGLLGLGLSKWRKHA